MILCRTHTLSYTERMKMSKPPKISEVIVQRYMMLLIAIEYAFYNLLLLFLIYTVPSKIDILVIMVTASGIGGITSYYSFKYRFCSEVDKFLARKHRETERDKEVALHYLKGTLNANPK